MATNGTVLTRQCSGHPSGQDRSAGCLPKSVSHSPPNAYSSAVFSSRLCCDREGWSCQAHRSPARSHVGHLVLRGQSRLLDRWRPDPIEGTDGTGAGDRRPCRGGRAGRQGEPMLAGSDSAGGPKERLDLPRDLPDSERHRPAPARLRVHPDMPLPRVDAAGNDPAFWALSVDMCPFGFGVGSGGRSTLPSPRGIRGSEGRLRRAPARCRALWFHVQS